MGQGQDPYGDAGGFTPYEPDATPDAEPSAEGEPPPFVPYGGGPSVPYGGAVAQFYSPTTTPSGGRRVLPWVIVLGVVLASCGGGVSAIVGILGGFGSSPEPERAEVLVNDLSAGDCLVGAGFATDEPVSGLEIVDCSAAHDVQVLDVNVLDSQEAADYDYGAPGSSGKFCGPVLSAAQQVLLRGNEYRLVAFTETANPLAGDKVACLLKRADGAPIHEFLPAVDPEPSA